MESGHVLFKKALQVLAFMALCATLYRTPWPLAATPIVMAGEARDFNGHDQKWWQERVKIWQKKKSDAQGHLAHAQDALNNIPFDPTYTYKAQKQAKIQKEIEADEAAVSEANRMLTDVLPEEARKAGAMPGWLRD